MSINESSAAENLELLKELVTAGEDPRSLKWAAMRVRVDGTLAQVGMLNRIEERAAAKHDQPKSATKQVPRTAADDFLDRAMGIDR